MASASDQSEQHPLRHISVRRTSRMDVSSDASEGDSEAAVFPKPQRSWNPFRRRTSSSDLDHVGYGYQSADAVGLALTDSSLGDDNHGRVRLLHENDAENDSAVNTNNDNHNNNHNHNGTNGNGDSDSVNMRDAPVPGTTPEETNTTTNTPAILPPDSPSSPWLQKNLSSNTVALNPVVACPTNKSVLHRRLSWTPITIMILAIYCTLLSGLYVVVAFWKPRYGNRISNDGGILPSTATLLSALFAKTIELSYVTVFVAFLGQILSRSAIVKSSRGISLSDISMRAWITQPGSLIVNWEALRYSALTVPGVLSLMAMLVAMVYTTAAEALVSPKLIMGSLEDKQLVGSVRTQFASSDYLKIRCQTPVTNSMDPQYSGSSCLEMEHVGQAFHNYQEYIARWGELVATGKGQSTKLASRPLPMGAMYDNTSVTGSWINIQNMTELSTKHGRLVNNVTAALPHGNVIAAAQDSRNGIRQPHDPSGAGKYDLEASVPSPAVNVLCVGMTADELTPLVYNRWPEGTHFNATTWDLHQPNNVPQYPSWLNGTVVDDIFGWGQKYGQRPPIFGKLPESYNTIVNTTGHYTDAIYLLARSPDKLVDPEYVVCSFKAKQTGVCSTRYSAAASGANFSVNCENSENKLQYNHKVPNMVEGNWLPDWRVVAALWATAVNLNSGITDGAASNARLVSQMIPQSRKRGDPATFSYNPKLPSIAEALAVMVSSTLTLSSQDAPFVPFWNYTTPHGYLEGPPVDQTFDASLRAMTYASGPSKSWQDMFYVILLFAFLTSAICLIFMIFEVRGKQMTDFTEPLNLFALAVNSPSSTRLQGACGTGPYGTQLKERWYVGMEEEREHYYIRTKAEENAVPGRSSSVLYLEPGAGLGAGLGAGAGTGLGQGGGHHHHRRHDSSVTEEGSYMDDDVPLKSPRVHEYRRLSSKRRSWLI